MPRRRDPKPAMQRGRRGPPQPRPLLAPSDHDRRLAEEVLYLHSLWRRGPPPAPVPIGTTERKRKRPAVAARKAKSIELKRLKRAAAAEPQENGSEWPLAPSPPKSSPKTWPDAAPPSTSTPAKPPPQPPSPGARAQREALRAAAKFLSNCASDDDDGGSESEGEQDAKGFITGLFVRDAALRRHYERGWAEGQFQCLACAGGRRKTKRFKGCVALVQHATAAAAATRYGRPRAHRALADVLCRVLGWVIGRLPSIVIDPRGTLGQAIAAEESDDSGEDDDSSDDEDEEEDDETEMEDSSTDGEEDNECRNSEESAEKEAMEEISPSNCNEISKNEVFHNEPVQQDNAGKGDSLDQGDNGEVHKQEVAKESSEQENTNDAYPPDSEDTCKNEEQCKEDAVQKEEKCLR